MDKITARWDLQLNISTLNQAEPGIIHTNEVSTRGTNGYFQGILGGGDGEHGNNVK